MFKALGHSPTSSLGPKNAEKRASRFPVRNMEKANTGPASAQHMGKVVSIRKFSTRRCNSTAALAGSLRIHDLRARNEEFMRFLATERSHHLSKVVELDQLMKTISEEWGIEFPLTDPETS
jgi:hypothetical protein